MVPIEKMLEVARGLLDLTKQNKIRWEEIHAPGATAYTLQRPSSGSGATIRFISPESEPDTYTLLLLNPEGQTVGRLALDESDREYTLLYDLYQQAGRTATGWDKVLADMERFIADGGQPPKRKSAGQPGEDIPF